MNSFIAPNQSSFVGSWNLLDGVVVVAKETLDFGKRNKIPSLLLKVDFEKTYGSVNWAFLDYMIDRFGLNAKLRKWIQFCLESSSISILVNGSHTKEFKIYSGLRQGDPLAPFVFFIVTDGIGALMTSICHHGLFSDVQVRESRVNVSHL